MEIVAAEFRKLSDRLTFCENIDKFVYYINIPTTTTHMKHSVVVCLVIIATIFGCARAALSCAALTARANTESNSPAFVERWVNESFALYADSPTFGLYFSSDNETYLQEMKDRHVIFYGLLILCNETASWSLNGTFESMESVHALLNVSAAAFEEYVELTRQALNTIVPLSIGETADFYRLFDTTFRTSDSVCSEPDCLDPPFVDLSDKINSTDVEFSPAWVALTTSTQLSFNSSSELTLDLYIISSTAVQPCTYEKFGANSIQPKEVAFIADMTGRSTGTYYVFESKEMPTSCVSPSDLHNNSMLIIDYTAPASPVEPVAAPVASPVAEPVNSTEPVAEPMAVPVAEPVAEPVTAPVDPPVAAPVTPPVPPPLVDGVVGSNGGYIAAIVILVLLVVGLLIAVIVMGVKLRNRPPVIMA